MPDRSILTSCTALHYTTRNVQLHNAGSQNDANEILVAVRNMFDPNNRVYLITSTNIVSLGSYPQELDRIEALIHTLDRPRKAYRITFTFVDTDSGKRVGIQHYSIIAAEGQRATMKQGSKVPRLNWLLLSRRQLQSATVSPTSTSV